MRLDQKQNSHWTSHNNRIQDHSRITLGGTFFFDLLLHISAVSSYSTQSASALQKNHIALQELSLVWCSFICQPNFGWWSTMSTSPELPLLCRTGWLAIPYRIKAHSIRVSFLSSQWLIHRSSASQEGMYRQFHTMTWSKYYSSLDSSDRATHRKLASL